MVADSYCATCYIENDNGTYHMECDMTCGDKPIFSKYDGEDFIDGLNQMMNDMTEQMTNMFEKEVKEETPEEKIVRLEGIIDQLKAENEDLVKIINDFNNDKNKTPCQYQNKQNSVENYILDILDEIMKDDKNYNWVGKEIKFK